MIPAKFRGPLYIGLFILAAVLAVGIVVFGLVSQDDVLSIVELIALLYAAFVGLLARANLTPD